MKIYTPTIKQACCAYFAFFACLILWFAPFTHDYFVQLDITAFFIFNGSLKWSIVWLKLWGWLNHNDETWMNVIIMMFINIIGIITQKPMQRRQALVITLYFWLFFQLGLLALHWIFTDILTINRESPSTVLQPIVVISQVLDIPCKDISYNCFPAGHAFVAIYWAGFTALYAPKSIKWFAWSCVPFLIMPRLFSGAHWLSDVILTITMACIWLIWARYFLDMIMQWKLAQSFTDCT